MGAIFERIAPDFCVDPLAAMWYDRSAVELCWSVLHFKFLISILIVSPSILRLAVHHSYIYNIDLLPELADPAVIIAKGGW